MITPPRPRGEPGALDRRGGRRRGDGPRDRRRPGDLHARPRVARRGPLGADPPGRRRATPRTRSAPSTRSPRSSGGPTRPAPGRSSTRSTTRRTARSTWRRSAPTSWPARPTSSSGRTSGSCTGAPSSWTSCRPTRSARPTTAGRPGTQNHEGIAGTLAAVEYLADVGDRFGERRAAGAARRERAGRRDAGDRGATSASCRRGSWPAWPRSPGLRVHGLADPAPGRRADADLRGDARRLDAARPGRGARRAAASTPGTATSTRRPWSRTSASRRPAGSSAWASSTTRRLRTRWTACSTLWPTLARAGDRLEIRPAAWARPRPSAAWTGSVGQPRWRAASSTSGCGAWPCGSWPASRSSGHVRRAVSARKAISAELALDEVAARPARRGRARPPRRRGRAASPASPGQSSGKESSKPGGAPCSTRSPAKTTPVSGDADDDVVVGVAAPEVAELHDAPAEVERRPHSSNVRSGGSSGVAVSSSARSGTQRTTFSRWAGPCSRSASAQPACDQISHGRKAALPKAWSKWTWVFDDHPRQAGEAAQVLDAARAPGRCVDRVSIDEDAIAARRSRRSSGRGTGSGGRRRRPRPRARGAWDPATSSAGVDRAQPLERLPGRRDVADDEAELGLVPPAPDEQVPVDVDSRVGEPSGHPGHPAGLVVDLHEE